MGKPGRLEETMSAGGFVDLRAETVRVEFDFASPGEYADFLHDLSGTLRRALEEKPAEVRARVRKGIESATEKHRDANGRVRLVNEVRCVSGER
jgi:hypothetical protein